MDLPNNKNLLEDSKADLPSNELLVDSLTKDITKNLIVNDNNIRSDDCSLINNNEETDEKASANRLSNDNVLPEGNKLNNTREEELDEVLGEDDKDKKKDNFDEDDFIDEEHLKDLEVDCSEEDKICRKEEAESFKNQGNIHFKAGEFKEAVIIYTKGLRTCPLAYSKDRSILYANRAAAKVKLFLSESAIEDCSKAIELDPEYLKAYIRRAQLYENSEKLDEALEDYKKILEIEPSNREAMFATMRLPQQINERNEKLKTEMLGKLKDLGNMFLKPFGLSTNNFQMVQDPNTGGYSINFSQNSPNHS